jgi:polyisoprenyl-teichoic acid--peptidoglycan teichoic acid transferase
MRDYTVYRARSARGRARSDRLGAGPLPGRPAGAPTPGRRGRLWARLLRIVSLLIVGVIGLTAGLVVGWLEGNARALASHHPALVKQAERQLAPPLPGQAVNIAVMGSDASNNSDSLMVWHLDPRTKSISMLSVPRDLWVDIPGVGMSKINAALPTGGPALTIKTLHQVLGIPINHFAHIDFAGFWDVVRILGGVYLQIDHKYTDAASGTNQVLMLPGYQLADGNIALHFVRFRHDQYYDFGRIQRQQIFLRELQRQAVRWRDWSKLPSVIRAITRHTDSDISSLRQLLSLASMILQLDTSHIYVAHLEGATPTINGQSVVVDTPQQIRAAVARFENPPRAPAAAGVAASGAGQQAAGQAGASAAAGSSTSISQPQTVALPSTVHLLHETYAAASWRAAARGAGLPVYAPTVWPAGFTYDSSMPFRAYRVNAGQGRTVSALVAVGRAPASLDPKQGAFDIQEIKWTKAPILLNPTSVRVLGGRRYLLYYQDAKLATVAFIEGATAYWVTNTIDNALPGSVLLAIATSLQPLR